MRIRSHISQAASKCVARKRGASEGQRHIAAAGTNVRSRRLKYYQLDTPPPALQQRPHPSPRLLFTGAPPLSSRPFQCTPPSILPSTRLQLAMDRSGHPQARGIPQEQMEPTAIDKVGAQLTLPCHVSRHTVPARMLTVARLLLLCWPCVAGPVLHFCWRQLRLHCAEVGLDSAHRRTGRIVGVLRTVTQHQARHLSANITHRSVLSHACRPTVSMLTDHCCLCCGAVLLVL